jgi:hypothetical protein
MLCHFVLRTPNMYWIVSKMGAVYTDKLQWLVAYWTVFGDFQDITTVSAAINSQE